MIITQNPFVDDPAHDARQQRTFVMLLDLRARALDDVSVLHSRRTCSLAGETTETAIDVRDERIADGKTSGVHLQHLIDAPARRIHLRAKYAISWTMVQTQSAMDAGGVEVPIRLVLHGEV